MEDIFVKQAEESDLEQILTHLEDFQLDDTNVAYEQFYIAVNNQEIIGFGRIKPYDKIYELSSVGVLPEHRSKGVGQKLINYLIDIFPSNDIWITTKIDEYFKQFGFKECHTPPEEIQYKQIYICSKLCKSTKSTHCMLLKKNLSNELEKDKTTSSLTCTKQKKEL